MLIIAIKIDDSWHIHEKLPITKEQMRTFWNCWNALETFHDESDEDKLSTRVRRPGGQVLQCRDFTVTGQEAAEISMKYALSKG